MAIAHALTDTTGDISSMTATLSVSKPTSSGSTHRLILVICSETAQASLNAVTGDANWTRIGSSLQLGSVHARSVTIDAFHAAGNVATASFSNSKTGSNYQQGYVCAAFTGVDATTPIDVTGSGDSNEASGTLTISSVTIVMDQSVDVVVAGDWLGTNAMTMTNFTVSENGHAQAATALLYNATPKSVGATGTATLNTNSGASETNVALRFALRPASASTFAPPPYQGRWRYLNRKRVA